MGSKWCSLIWFWRSLAKKDWWVCKIFKTNSLFLLTIFERIFNGSGFSGSDPDIFGRSGSGLSGYGQKDPDSKQWNNYYFIDICKVNLDKLHVFCFFFLLLSNLFCFVFQLQQALHKVIFYKVSNAGSGSAVKHEPEASTPCPPSPCRLAPDGPRGSRCHRSHAAPGCEGGGVTYIAAGLIYR